MYASPKQQEALKTNRYLQGFGEAASELFSSIDGYQLDFKIIISDYAEGRYDFLKSWNHLKAKMSEEEVIKTIKEVYDKYKTILDPHTAIGYNAFDKVNLKGNNIVLATAHPCKFPDAIKKSIDQNAELPKELMFIMDEKEKYDIIDNNLDKIKKHIKERI